MSIKRIAHSIVAITACICTIIPFVPASAATCEFRTGDDGKQYWYEDGVKQGTYDDGIGVLGDGTIRGREIYDSVSDGWYWLDSVYDGAKAVGKEVWIPYIYQDELIMSPDGIGRMANGLSDDDRIIELAQASITSEADMSTQVEEAIRNRTGKWVRYDENGAMLKGWVKIEGALAVCYPDQAGNTYYYDRQTGLMAKGNVTINGIQYHFDEISGVLDSHDAIVDQNSDNQNDLTDTSENTSDQNNENIDSNENNDSDDSTDYFIFGSYEQDGDADNGKEPIEWVILDENSDGILLISRYVLDCKPFNNDTVEATWETCSLRSWMNNEFFNTAFSDAEKERILTTHVVNNDNAYYGTDGGNDTYDKVFCLSNDEILKYYTFNYYDDSVMSGYCQALIIPATQYAKNSRLVTDTIMPGVYEYCLKDYGYTEDCVGLSGAIWWLRTPCEDNYHVCSVGDWGVSGAGGGIGNIELDVGVRPAIYINK